MQNPRAGQDHQYQSNGAESAEILPSVGIMEAKPTENAELSS